MKKENINKKEEHLFTSTVCSTIPRILSKQQNQDLKAGNVRKKSDKLKFYLQDGILIWRVSRITATF